MFKAIKAAAGGMGLDRVFITGVSPVVLSDMTSGYNVGEDIYLLSQFNDLCGFTEREVSEVLRQLASEDGDWSPDKALATMRTFYNVYRFSVADVLAAVKDQPFMASLLYFFGILTLDGLTAFDECRLRIPNLVARGLYVERLVGRALTV